MHHNFTYRGKQTDCTAAIILMAMGSHGITNIPHPECLTSRPFNWRCCPISPQRWLLPYPDPFEGLLQAFNILGVRYKFEIINTTSADSNSLSLKIKQWLHNGPVIIGPLDRTKIWNRIDSLYYQGAAHFIFIFDMKDEDHFITHDPEGCPYFIISKNKIKSALNIEHSKNGILQIKSISALSSKTAIFSKIYTFGIRNLIRATGYSDSGSNGLYSLAQRIESKRLKSSEEGALNFALPFFGFGIKQLIEFFSDLSCLSIQNIDHFQKKFPIIFKILSEDIEVCAYAMVCLRDKNQKQLTEQLKIIATNRRRLEEIFSSIY